MQIIGYELSKINLYISQVTNKVIHTGVKTFIFKILQK